MFPYPKFNLKVKDNMHFMEHQVFSLANKPVVEIVNYEHNDVKIQLIPSAKGLPTVNDKDVLIFIGSLISYAISVREVPRHWVNFDAIDYFNFTDKSVGSNSYIQLKEAIERCYGAYYMTNVEINGVRFSEPFRILEKFKIVEKTKSGKGVIKVAIKISDWLYKIYINGDMLLNIPVEYFKLSPTQKAIYGHIRKGCGTSQGKYKIGIVKLNKKIGQGNKNPKYIRAEIKKLIKNDNGKLLDYKIKLDKNDNLIVYALNDKGSSAEFNDLIKSMEPDYKAKAKNVSRGQLKALNEAEELYQKLIKAGKSKKTAQGIRYARMKCALE